MNIYQATAFVDTLRTSKSDVVGNVYLRSLNYQMSLEKFNVIPKTNLVNKTFHRHLRADEQSFSHIISLTGDLFLSFLTTQLTASETSFLHGDSNERNAILVSRRSVVLTLVGSTPTENAVLHTILQKGYLSVVKIWMDDVFKGSLGKSGQSLWSICPIQSTLI